MQIVEIVSALISKKYLPHSCWVDASSTVVCIMNRTPTIVVHNVMLEEKYIGR